MGRVNTSISATTLVYISPILFVFLTLLIFYQLTKAGFSKIISLLLVVIILGSGIFTSYNWGIDVPQAMLIYALSIVMAGILLSSKYAFATTLFIITTLFLLTQFTNQGFIKIREPWQNSPLQPRDISIYALTFMVIALVSWLSNREIEKSLTRARRSEAALKKERDLLEVKVEARTRELQRAQLEKMLHLYRLADFGRLAAGLIHDLVSPLTQITLDLELLDQTGTPNLVQQAMKSAKRMENFVQATRQQLRGQDTKTLFNLTAETQQVIEVLNHKVKVAQVTINLVAPPVLKTYGNPYRFHQLVANLLSNALDAYSQTKRKNNRVINLTLTHHHRQAILTVEDFGAGIDRKNMAHIFEPFFTTKNAQQGTGIGLSISQLIAEKNFHGAITVASLPHRGSTFTFSFPIIHHD